MCEHCGLQQDVCMLSCACVCACVGMQQDASACMCVHICTRVMADIALRVHMGWYKCVLWCRARCSLSRQGSAEGSTVSMPLPLADIGLANLSEWAKQTIGCCLCMCAVWAMLFCAVLCLSRAALIWRIMGH